MNLWWVPGYKNLSDNEIAEWLAKDRGLSEATVKFPPRAGRHDQKTVLYRQNEGDLDRK